MERKKETYKAIVSETYFTPRSNDDDTLIKDGEASSSDEELDCNFGVSFNDSNKVSYFTLYFLTLIEDHGQLN